jgi:hypothetical protein
MDDGAFWGRTPTKRIPKNRHHGDALKRLTMAWTTGPAYGLSFGYDGFGNKLSQTVTKGSAPASSITVDANNRITGQTYDANGNMTSGASSTLTYDVDNRVVTAAGLSGEQYSYNPSNKRVWKKRATGGGNFAEDVYFYGIDGQRQATPFQVFPMLLIPFGLSQQQTPAPYFRLALPRTENSTRIMIREIKTTILQLGLCGFRSMDRRTRSSVIMSDI